jgi:hypothetical protein
MDIKELIKIKENYVKVKAEMIAQQMSNTGAMSSTLSTCDYSNWDRELHRAMPAIVNKLKEMGISSTSKVNHGVTDWVFTI